MATAEEERMLDTAFGMIRAGDGESALSLLRSLHGANPRLSSLRYAAALAALQAGDIHTAMLEAAASVRRGERISDSHALAASAEALKPGSASWAKPGGNEALPPQDALLLGAIAEDQANAVPRLEWGIRLRTRGENEAAAKVLESARLRLHPVDAATVIETTLLLIRLEQAETDKLPRGDSAGESTASLFGAAYGALRRGDFEAGAGFLLRARRRAGEDLYSYLIADPAFAPYRDSAAVKAVGR